ncbi:MAG: carboxypeptidase-like regulatory domain-containing protein [Planctomycetota bacterium]|nr:carboxypeptidase-like regulatory domain-containing protein [Planctomycetota bacterium]
MALSDSLSLKGTVISKESGLPVEGAIVTVTRVFPPEPPRTTLTDSSGQFTFSELQRAEYSVKAAAKGYVQEPQVPDSCRLDNTLTYITIFMQTSGRITGVVKDFSGLPVADAKVSFGRWTTTREDGTYAMDVQPGTADLIVTHNDFSLESVDLVEVREGDWRVVNVTLRQGCLLHGRVTDSFGKPVVGASVRITGYWRNFNASYIYPNTSTDENGEYRFPHAAEGTYIIELQSQGYEVIYKTIEIPKGLKEHKEDFSLLKGARISGSVFDSSGRGVPDVNVRVKGGPSVTGAIAMTRNDGSFVVEGVSPARITLFVLRKKATPLYLLKM